MRNWRISSGWDVYDASGSKLGSIGDVSGDYFHMDTGFLGLGEGYYVPFDAISDVRDGKVYLNVTKDQLKTMGWEGKPAKGTEGFRTSTGEPSLGVSRGERTDLGTTEERRMPLREEQLQVNRSRERVGEVDVSKDVVEERRHERVPYTEEQVYVEQRPASGEARGPIGEGDEIRVPVSQEEVEVSKRPVTYGEVVVGKEKVTREKEVDETLRREEPRIRKEGDVTEIDDRTKKKDDFTQRRENR